MMLKKLGRRLTLLNFLISAAILITMTVVSLGITEEKMAVQYENDLQSYLASFFPMLLSNSVSEMEANALRIRLPDKYIVYMEGDSQQHSILIGKSLSAEALQHIAAETGNLAIGDEPAERSDVVLFSNFGTEDVFDASVGSSFFRVEQTVVEMLENYRLLTIDHTSYRVATCKMSMGAIQRTMLLLQDRTEELQGRNQLRLLFAACVAGGLFLVVLSSLYVSARSIRPVQTSIREQQEFVAAASHELRTPVAAIRASAEVLGDAELGEFSPFLQSIHGESVRMSQLVDDLMSLARADAGQLTMEMRPIDAAEVAEDTLCTIRPMAEKNELSITSNLLPALMIGDPGRLRQILLVLLDNSIRYTPPGGSILVTTRSEDHSVLIRVEDSGIGIAEEHKARVFDRFYCVDSARSNASGGSGLGLSIARQLVALMKGRIEISDAANGGSRFTVVFPSASIDSPRFRRHSYKGITD